MILNTYFRNILRNKIQKHIRQNTQKDTQKEKLTFLGRNLKYIHAFQARNIGETL